MKLRELMIGLKNPNTAKQAYRRIVLLNDLETMRVKNTAYQEYIANIYKDLKLKEEREFLKNNRK